MARLVAERRSFELQEGEPALAASSFLSVFKAERVVNAGHVGANVRRSLADCPAMRVRHAQPSGRAIQPSFLECPIPRRVPLHCYIRLQNSERPPSNDRLRIAATDRILRSPRSICSSIGPRVGSVSTGSSTWSCSEESLALFSGRPAVSSQETIPADHLEPPPAQVRLHTTALVPNLPERRVVQLPTRKPTDSSPLASNHELHRERLAIGKPPVVSHSPMPPTAVRIAARPRPS
jgi:hypothetical protein